MNTDLNQYYLMHKNDIAGIMTLSSSTNALINFSPIDNELMPLGHTNKKSFSNWWERRAIPKHQNNQKILLNNKSNIEYMVDNLSLSLVDTYWIKPIESEYTWEKVNLYTHHFTEIDFDFEDLNNNSPFKPSSTTQGELQKRWVIQDNERYLIKGNYGAMYRQSINEVFASIIHKLQEKSYTEYKLIDLPTTMGDGLGCISKNFTTENLEFVPGYDITFYGKQKNDESVYQYYIRNCIELGLNSKDIKNFMDYQVLSDFLITNTDRHFLNFGILRDSNTLQFVCPAPIFDSGNSMFYNTNYKKENVFNIPITSFYKNEFKMLECVDDYSLLDLNKLPPRSFMNKLYSKDPYSVVYLNNMLDGYEQKIEMIDALQRGLSLNKRHPLFYETYDICSNQSNNKENQELFKEQEIIPNTDTDFDINI